MVWGARNMTTLSGRTTLVGIIGYPISHSLSPTMQNEAFAAAALDYIYVPFAVAPDNLEQAVNGLKVLGLRGFNVTIPHKTAIIPFLDRLDESAEASGAVNTILNTESGLTGYNTDGDGLVDSLSTDLDFTPGSGQIIVLGAGGASRGAIAALCRSGAKRIVICNRSLENAQTVMIEMTSRYPETHIEVIGQKQLCSKILGITSLLLNTTSIGMKGERFEGLNLAHLPEYSTVYDMVYSYSSTPLVKEASQAGLRASNGLGMLVAQGERAFKIWTGQNPPEGIMRKALNSI